MNSRIFLAFIATTALTSTAHAEDFNWGGFYGGVSAGISGSTSDAKVDLENGPRALRGWSSNDMFSSREVTDNFYRTSRTADWQTSPTTWEHNGNSPASSATGSLGGYATSTSGIGTPSFAPSTPWDTDLGDDTFSGLGSLRFGTNFQFDAIVLGAEVDGSLLQNDFSDSFDISESASLNASRSVGIDNFDSDPSGSNEYGYNWSENCDGASPAQGLDACSYSSSYAATYTQNGDFAYSSALNGLYTMRARAGYAVGRTLLFATGGLAVGRIEMSTSANTSEKSDAQWSGTARRDPTGGGTLTQTTDSGSSSASANTTWSESDSKTAYGYAIGGGVSFAVTENVIFTGDGYYYDLGEHSITATSSSGAASYTVSQHFDGYVLRTGLEWKF